MPGTSSEVQSVPTLRLGQPRPHKRVEKCLGRGGQGPQVSGPPPTKPFFNSLLGVLAES